MHSSKVMKNMGGLSLGYSIRISAKKIMTFLQYGSIPDKTKEKLYIAITRTRYSVGFIIPDDKNLSSFYNKKIVEWCE